MNFERFVHVVSTSLNPDGSLRFRQDGILHGQDVFLHEAPLELAWQMPGGRSREEVYLVLRRRRPELIDELSA